MARFVFEYEAVLRKRRIDEREQQRCVAVIERERFGLEQRLRGVRDQLLGERGTLGRAVEAGQIDASFLRLQAATAQRRRVEADRIAVELAGVYKRLQEARGALTRAAASRRSMELLRERRLEAYRREQDKREGAELDDLSNARVCRAGGGLADGGDS